MGSSCMLPNKNHKKASIRLETSSYNTARNFELGRTQLGVRSMDVYRRMLQDPIPEFETYYPDDVYVDKMEKILSAYPCIGVPREPSQLIGNVFIGSTLNSENIPLLKSLGINYILNCAPSGLVPHRRVKQYYPPETSIKGYEELQIEDSEYGEIRSYMDRALSFIEYARARGGRVLIHCPAASRSGAIAICYLLTNGIPLLEATKMLKDKRRVALSNSSFMRQLVQYARDRGMLESDLNAVKAPQYHTRLNSYRINSAHLPLYAW